MWQAYELILRLHSPLHIGRRIYKNLMETRRYVPSRVLLGLWTARLTELVFSEKPLKTCHFWKVGSYLNSIVRTTYFYIATRKKDKWKVWFPWENPDEFEYRFLSSELRTSLNPEYRSAIEGTLHEVEYISPVDQVSGKEVYLMGYVFIKKNCNKILLRYKCLLDKISDPDDLMQKIINLTDGAQLGGERTYGWGLVSVKNCRLLNSNDSPIDLFESENYKCTLNHCDGPLCEIREVLPAHLLYYKDSNPGIYIRGQVEPLVRKLWHQKGEIKDVNVAWAPGSLVRNHCKCIIKELGYLIPAK